MNIRNRTYVFKVSLKGIEPPIWRLIEVPANYSFWDLHVAVQDAMGWLDYHLHAFRILNSATGEVEEIGIPGDEPLDDEHDCLPGWEVPVAEYFRHPGDRAEYEYDFGDGWKHEVVLEAIADRAPKTKYPRCLGGARACPPEDCGGTRGYEQMLSIIQDPSDEEYESTVDWLGGHYDPDTFDPNAVRFDSPKKRWKIAFASN